MHIKKKNILNEDTLVYYNDYICYGDSYCNVTNNIKNIKLYKQKKEKCKDHIDSDA